MIAWVISMTEPIAHRGPDGVGSWVSQEAGIALGHRRLSIIDCSEAGSQPMVSCSGRHVIAYNGEIYNTDELRADLEARGLRLRGHSDTEVLLESCALWGTEEALKRVNGMFAFVLWDRKTRHLTLARDRLGIKPLYVGRSGKTFLFASQVKSLFRHPEWHGRLDCAALAQTICLSYRPGSQSIFQGVRQIAPGTIEVIHPDGSARVQTYWSAEEAALLGIQRRDEAISRQDALEQLEALLSDSVSRRLVSDVPFGAFLSGGIDSSTVVALMCKASTSPVKTFSIGFNEKNWDESSQARSVANHLGTDHHELIVAPEDAMSSIADLPSWYDEPFADPSQIPTYLVSRFARAHVTVSLSGDGGDELFAGYNRYTMGQRLWNVSGHWPAGAKHVAKHAFVRVPARFWDGIAALIPSAHRPSRLGEKITKAVRALGAETKEEFYSQIVEVMPSHEVPLKACFHSMRTPWTNEGSDGIETYLDWMRFRDLTTYLPNDILTKLDRASMAVGLEARVPLLDHRVVEFAWSLPHTLLVCQGQGKWLLRQLALRHIPQNLIQRPKKGFDVPLGAWLRGPLRPWAEDMLDPTSIISDGLFDPVPIHDWWKSHISGGQDMHGRLWPILMTIAWHRHWKREGAFR